MFQESSAQISSIRKGLDEVIPGVSLNFFSSIQLERLICGVDDVDVSLLKQRSVSNVSCKWLFFLLFYLFLLQILNFMKLAGLLEMLWKTLEEFTPAQRCSFIRFTWGRSRLPHSQGLST
jgi:hypothetical protein